MLVLFVRNTPLTFIYRALYSCGRLRCCLVHEGKEVRAGGLRLLRYLVQSAEDVEALIAVNTVPLIVRCVSVGYRFELVFDNALIVVTNCMD